MFGLWYIVFGVAFIAIIALVCVIFFGKWHDKNYALYKKYFDIYCFGETRDERKKAEIDKEKYDKKSDRCEKAGIAFGATFLMCFLALLILITVSISEPIGAKREVRQFEYNKEYIENSIETVKGDSDYLTITGDIFEYNKWLADVKSRTATYGRFSKYYGLVEDLEPIRLPTKTAD